MSVQKSALVAAGVDPTGGAGLTLDVAFLTRLGVRALPLVTALTVQDDLGVQRVDPVDLSRLTEAADAARRTVAGAIAVMKTGLVPTLEQALRLVQIAEQLRVPLVVDPILASGTGDMLHRGDPLAIVAPLVAAATLITPNLREAEALAQQTWDRSPTGLLAIARRLASDKRTCAISGGHAGGETVPMAIAGPDGEALINAPRAPLRATHGTGCALASTAAGYMALGLPPLEAVAAAHRFVAAALAGARGIDGIRTSPEPWVV